MKFEYGVFVWDRIPQTIMDQHGGSIEGLRTWMQNGGMTSYVEEGGESEDATFIFFNGDEQLGGYDGDGSDGHYFFNNEDGSIGLILWFMFNDDDDAEFKPEISVSDIDGWDLPDEFFIVGGFDHTLHFTTIIGRNRAPQLLAYLQKTSRPIKVSYEDCVVDYIGEEKDLDGNAVLSIQNVKVPLPDFDPVITYMTVKVLGNCTNLNALRTSNTLSFKIEWCKELADEQAGDDILLSTSILCERIK